jgi:uncharacterized protein
MSLDRTVQRPLHRLRVACRYVTLPPYVEDAGDGAIVHAFVQPRAAKNAISGVHGAAVKIKVTAPPVDDRANRAAEELLARLVGHGRGRVTVVAGRSSRHKQIKVVGATAEEVAAAIEAVAAR